MCASLQTLPTEQCQPGVSWHAGTTCELASWVLDGGGLRFVALANARLLMRSRSRKKTGPLGCIRLDPLAALLMGGMSAVRINQLAQGVRPLTRWGAASHSHSTSCPACRHGWGKRPAAEQ